MAPWIIVQVIVERALSVATAICQAGQPASELAATSAITARCALPFQDNAVLQQLIHLPVWGTSAPGARVTVSFNTQTKTAQADAEGHWQVVLDPMTAQKLKTVHGVPQGLTMRILCQRGGKQTVTELHNLVVGEVWLCSGQSNIAGKLHTNHPTSLPAFPKEAPDYPALRQMVSPADEPWQVCTPQTAKDFRKVCFYFARSVLHGTLVPVGIINASVGGSKMETWLNERPFPSGGNYQRMIQPLVGYGLRGAVWYQGESNERDRRNYGPKLRALIVGWRKVWNQSSAEPVGGPDREFSFYFVQLPGIGTSVPNDPRCGDGRAEIRQAQFEALTLPHTGMAVTIDTGSKQEHPANKYDTGVRLARLALHYDYGMDKLTPTGPLYKGCKIEGHALRVQFDNVGKGLVFAKKQGVQPPTPTPSEQTPWLSIQAKDGSWHWATGKIDGSDLIVSCPEVQDPIAARYAYTGNPTGVLLYNKDGLPAAPFTTCGYDPTESK